MRIKYSEFNCDRGPLRFSAKEFEARLPYVYPLFRISVVNEVK